MSPHLRTALDFGPLAVFFTAYRMGGVQVATASLVAATLLALIVTYVMERRIAVMPLVSGVIVTIFGGLTIYLHDDYFIKIKPTVVNLLFASVLLGGLCFGKSMFKYVLGHALQLQDEAWRALSLRWGIFFVFLAGLNEFIWRNYSTDFWVNFKVFGMFGLTMLFTMLQVPLIKKHWLQEAEVPVDTNS